MSQKKKVDTQKADARQYDTGQAEQRQRCDTKETHFFSKKRMPFDFPGNTLCAGLTLPLTEPVGTELTESPSIELTSSCPFALFLAEVALESPRRMRFCTLTRFAVINRFSCSSFQPIAMLPLASDSSICVMQADFVCQMKRTHRKQKAASEPKHRNPHQSLSLQ